MAKKRKTLEQKLSSDSRQSRAQQLPQLDRATASFQFQATNISTPSPTTVGKATLEQTGVIKHDLWKTLIVTGSIIIALFVLVMITK